MREKDFAFFQNSHQYFCTEGALSSAELQKHQEERKWAKKIWKIFKIQGHLERGKHMQPILSEYIQDFAFMLKTQYNVRGEFVSNSYFLI
jgi:hypothetical protein